MGTAVNSMEKYAPYDKILVDAPCNVDRDLLRGRDEKMARWSVGIVARISTVKVSAERQLKLLRNALWLLKEGGVLLFCNRALAGGECDEVVEQLLVQETWRPLRAEGAASGGGDLPHGPQLRRRVHWAWGASREEERASGTPAAATRSTCVCVPTRFHLRSWAPWRKRPSDACSGTLWEHGCRRRNCRLNGGTAQRRRRTERRVPLSWEIADLRRRARRHWPPVGEGASADPWMWRPRARSTDR
ncbi:unnamed protein product [Prorocentrum cordatum]|uniref:SAM-dependent MTase RsmB/NOP-type domain-containing protein n=1 Tax=Prorocentrum cordatum TaxID=2364126 RepID=A0ABN9VHU5_9DINO|nr:unnamed protein product [Polarella glacialis]